MNALTTQLENASLLSTRLAQTRSLTDELFRLVRSDALYDRPIPERHRIVFYIGHLEAFDWNLIAHQTLGYDPAHKEFDHLFAFGIDPVDGGLPQDRPSDWPRLAEIHAYCQRVRERIDEILGSYSATTENRWKYPQALILNTAIEHRLMHAETLTYMLHQLSTEKKNPPSDYLPFNSPRIASVIDSRMVEIPEGSATLGASQEQESFAWDNEFAEHCVQVPAFAIGTHNVTNEEFLRFVRAGGYEDRSLWSDAGWAWIKAQDIAHPHLWIRQQDQWFYRTMFEEVPLPPHWPAYVSQAEAAAYARFVSMSLPTEEQFHRAVYGTPQGTERAYPWGDSPPNATLGNFDFQQWNPVPVGSYSNGRSAFGLYDALGNGWEWTATLFAPHPDFVPFPFYPGYSADFFDGKHFVAKGASPRTAVCFLRRSFRNWFQPHYPFVYASFRCVEN